MRVLIVNTEQARGGAALIARTLHEGLNALPGHESLFAYGRGPRTGDRQTWRFALQAEVCVHALLTRATGLQGYGTWLSTRRLVRTVREWKPDIIHFHNIHGYYLNLSIARAVGKLGTPVVWTLHDAWPLTGRCAYFFECSRWRRGCGHCPYSRTYPKTYFDTSHIMWSKKRELLGNVWKPVIVTPSQWLADLVSEACAGRCRIEVIPNGIDTQLFHPRDRAAVREKLGLPVDDKVILFVAADLGDERKGARCFYESLQYLRMPGWLAVTVGKKVELPRLAGGSAVRQLGYMRGREAMAEAYAAADLFCITSLDENFPTTVLESMACGTPVVGFSAGGIPEQVTANCGWLVTPRDARALGEAIAALLADDRLRETMGRNCRERAVAQYDQRQCVERYIALCRELAQGGKA